MFYDYYIFKMKDIQFQVPEWIKAERYEYCEQYDNREYKETRWEKIKNFFRKC